MAFAGVKAMLAGALRDRVAAVLAWVVAGILLATAWVLTVIAAVTWLAPRLGPIGALLAVAGALAVLALLVVWLAGAQNRRSAELRATTRALWAATAVSAASAILRGEPPAKGDPHATGQDPGGGHRSALLIAGGLALLLLAFLFPSGRAGGDDPPAPGPDGAA